MSQLSSVFEARRELFENSQKYVKDMHDILDFLNKQDKINPDLELIQDNISKIVDLIHKTSRTPGFNKHKKEIKNILDNLKNILVNFDHKFIAYKKECIININKIVEKYNLHKSHEFYESHEYHEYHEYHESHESHKPKSFNYYGTSDPNDKVHIGHVPPGVFTDKKEIEKQENKQVGTIDSCSSSGQSRPGSSIQKKIKEGYQGFTGMGRIFDSSNSNKSKASPEYIYKGQLNEYKLLKKLENIKQILENQENTLKNINNILIKLIEELETHEDKLDQKLLETINSIMFWICSNPPPTINMIYDHDLVLSLQDNFKKLSEITNEEYKLDFAPDTEKDLDIAKLQEEKYEKERLEHDYQIAHNLGNIRQPDQDLIDNILSSDMSIHDKAEFILSSNISDNLKEQLIASLYN